MLTTFVGLFSGALFVCFLLPEQVLFTAQVPPVHWHCHFAYLMGKFL